MYDWCMIGPQPCAYACAEVDPVTSQSYDISISTRRKNLSVFLVLMPMLMSTQFSLAYKCACAYAYAYALVENQALSCNSHIKTISQYFLVPFANIITKVKSKFSDKRLYNLK